MLPLVCLLLAPAADTPSPSAKWEKDVAAIEKRLKAKAPPADAIFFAGSSSIVLWPLDKSFPKHPVVKVGFGGSQTADTTHFAARLLTPFKPAVVVFYAGDNDIAAGKSAEQVRADFAALVKAVRAASPKTRFVYLGIKPSVKRWKLWPTMKKANDLIAADCKGDDRLTYFDTSEGMLGDDGKPRADLLRDDGLHLSEKGYALWTERLTKILPVPSK